MYVDVFIDLLFLINFSMDLMIFYISAKIMKIDIKLYRVIFTCSLSGIASAMILIYINNSVISFMLDALIYLISSCIVYFEKGKKPSYYIALFALTLGISMLLGGIMSGTFNILSRLLGSFVFNSDDGILTFILAAVAIVSGLFALRGLRFISKKGKARYCMLDIRFGDESFSVKGFIDSGNLVSSPMGKGVIFIDREKLSGIPKDADKLYLKGDYNRFCASVIPINSVNGHSVCVTFKPDDIHIKTELDDHKSDCLISISDINCDTYSAIVPLCAIKTI